MGEICGLKFHLIYMYISTSQKNLLKSLHAQNVSFLLLILHFWEQIYLLWSKKYFMKKALRMEEFQKYFF